MKIKNFVLRLQNLPERQKKIIFFTVMIISTLVLGFFYIQSTKKNLSKIGESLKSIDLPKLDISQPEVNLPNIDINDVVSDENAQIFNSNE